MNKRLFWLVVAFFINAGLINIHASKPYFSLLNDDYGLNPDSSLTIVPTIWNDTIPPYNFYGRMNFKQKNVLNSSFYISLSWSLTITVMANVPCTVLLFKENSPEDFSISYVASGASFSPTPWFTHTKNIDTPDDYEGYYNMVILPNVNPLFNLEPLQNVTPFAFVEIQGDFEDDYHYFDGYLSFPSYGSPSTMICPFPTIETDVEYNTFTANSNSDVKICLLRNNKVIAFNDNYTETSDHSWGTEARIRNEYDTIPTNILLLAPQNIDTIKTNLFLACRSCPRVQSLFPSMKANDIILAANSSSAYNCGAWVIGQWNRWRFPFFTLSAWYYSYGQMHNNMDDYLSFWGFTGGVSEEDADVDAWEYDGEWTHLSIRSNYNGFAYGYAWESKLGEEERIMHPRYALTCDTATFGNDFAPYGHVTRHYKTNVNYYRDVQFVFINEQFSDEEIILFEKMASKLSHKDKELFNSCYEDVESIYKKSGIENLRLMKLYNQYKEFVDLCSNNINFLGLLCLKLAKGEFLPMEIIANITQDHNENLMKVIREKDDIQYKGSSKRYIRTPVAMAISYVRLLLKEILPEYNKIDMKDESYSNDAFFDVSATGNHLLIKYNLEENTRISLFIQGFDNPYSQTLLNNKDCEKGLYQNSVSLFPGMYVISISLNGRVYSKKVKV